MKIEKVFISKYRSIKSDCTVWFDQNVTVLLGANDHGKTNVLNALLHLNKDDNFEDEDRNWDELDSTEYPNVQFTMKLATDEHDSLNSLAAWRNKEQVAANAYEQQTSQIEELSGQISSLRTHETTSNAAENEIENAQDGKALGEAEMQPRTDSVQLQKLEQRLERMSTERAWTEAAEVLASMKCQPDDLTHFKDFAENEFLNFEKEVEEANDVKAKLN